MPKDVVAKPVARPRPRSVIPAAVPASYTGDASGFEEARELSVMSGLDKPIAPPIGGRVHDIRKSRGLTLDELARQSGVSKSMLSQIERGRVNPTYATLWSITQALDIEISQLIEQAATSTESKGRIEHVKPYACPTIRSADGKCSARILSPIHAGLPFEWYEFLLEPGGTIMAEAHGHGAWEHMTVVDNQVKVKIGTGYYELAEGETIRYSAEQSHGVMNPTKKPSRCLLVVVSLDELRRLGWGSLPKRYTGGSNSHAD
jgi:XRE family transcriptional regulator, regulator of sulfur utilization